MTMEVKGHRKRWLPACLGPGTTESSQDCRSCFWERLAEAKLPQGPALAMGGGTRRKLAPRFCPSSGIIFTKSKGFSSLSSPVWGRRHRYPLALASRQRNPRVSAPDQRCHPTFHNCHGSRGAILLASAAEKREAFGVGHWEKSRRCGGRGCPMTLASCRIPDVRHPALLLCANGRSSNSSWYGS